MANVACLCCLVMFIFAVLGMEFFGRDDISKGYVNGMYNAHANFRYFGDAFMLLFREVGAGCFSLLAAFLSPFPLNGPTDREKL